MSISQNLFRLSILFQIGSPNRLWEEFRTLSLFFSSFDCQLTPGPKFVENAAGIEGISRGSLGSSTAEISVFKFPFPGLVDSSICLIDTPDIDGKERTLYDIFDMICVWFSKTYVQVPVCPVFVGPCYWHRFRVISYRKESLAGLLYFRPISNTRSMFRLPLMKSNYLKRLCQNELNRVTLTTTMWDGVDEKTGARHEDELKKLWKPLIDEGMSVKRFLNDPSSAFDIIHPIVQAASGGQTTIGRVLLVGRSLATTAIRRLQRDSRPIIVYERSFFNHSQMLTVEAESSDLMAVGRVKYDCWPLLSSRSTELLNC